MSTFQITFQLLKENRFACNINPKKYRNRHVLEIIYFGTKNVYSCAALPKNPTDRLKNFILSLGYSYIEKNDTTIQGHKFKSLLII